MCYVAVSVVSYYLYLASSFRFFFFFFNDPATTEIYTLSLHDALPIYACAVEEELAAKLRRADPPVIAVIRDGRTLLDCRTLTDAEVDEVANAVATARR